MATAFINISKDERSCRDLTVLQGRLGAFAAANGDHIDHWIAGDCDGSGRNDVLYIIKGMGRGDSLYFENVSRLGASMGNVLAVLSEAMKRGINVYGLEDGFCFDRSIDARSYLLALEQAADVYNSIISNRTKVALNKRRMEGKRLGRPVGTSDKMDVLIKHKDKIIRFIAAGVPYTDICRKYNVSYTTFRRFKLQEGLFAYKSPSSSVIEAEPASFLCGSKGTGDGGKE